MRRYEYLVKTFRVSVNKIDGAFTEELNKLGLEGWEVVTMSTPVSTVQKGGSATQDRSFVFQRQLDVDQEDGSAKSKFSSAGDYLRGADESEETEDS